MSEINPFAPKLEDMPEILPIFPLSGALLLPSGRLPLNIFEPRYKAMTENSISSNRLIGMILPREDCENPALYEMGCAGKITEFSETPDGRYMITLCGIARFKIARELSQEQGYRRVKTVWENYEDDIKQDGCLGLNRDKLEALLRDYFGKQDMDCDWDAVQNAPDGRLITCLAMVCPFEVAEKQALMEAQCCKTRAEMFMAMLEMALRGESHGENKH